MNPASRPRGVYSPVVTPFSSNLHPDHDRFLRHCRWLTDQDVGLAVFGTNSEANSLAVDEKKRLLDTLVSAGLPVERLMPGTGCAALTDSIELTKHAVASGCHHVLMLPPFYYKGVSDDGIFRSFAEIIERVGSDALRIYVYHIPQVSQVPLGLALIERLHTRLRGVECECLGTGRWGGKGECQQYRCRCEASHARCTKSLRQHGHPAVNASQPMSQAIPAVI